MLGKRSAMARETSAESERKPARNEPKRDLLAAEGDLRTLAALPRALLELVLSFALKNVAVELRPVRRKGWRRLARPKVPIEALGAFRAVCRDWDAMIRDIVRQYRARTVKINLSHKPAEEQRQLVEGVGSRGEAVQDLRIALFGHLHGHGGEEQLRVDWDALLARCPNLHKLDVSKMMFLTRREMIALLDAASMHCLKLQSLLLPLPVGWTKTPEQLPRFRRARRKADDSEQDDALVEALGRALERWFARGRHRGLRQLMMPHLARNSNDFVASIAKHCPDMELLDGWKLTYLNDGWGPITCDDEWHLSLETWEKFCSFCVGIREFNWVVTPFADAFLVPFGKTPKYRLTDLSLDFSEAFDVLSSSVSTSTSDGLCFMLEGVPYLKRLKVGLHPRSRIDLSIFDDSVMAKLAQTNQYLEQFSIAEAGQYKARDAVESITNVGIQDLASMPHLSDISIDALKDGRQYDFSPFVIAAPRTIKQRNIKIGLLESFEDSILPLAWQIADQTPGTFTDRTFAVLLVNQGYRRGISKAPGLPQYWEPRFHEVQAGLRERHPNIRFQITFEKHRTRLAPVDSQKVMYCMSKFAIFTTDWVYPDTIGGTFYRGDITYNPDEDKAPFSWIMKFG